MMRWKKVVAATVVVDRTSCKYTCYLYILLMAIMLYETSLARTQWLIANYNNKKIYNVHIVKH